MSVKTKALNEKLVHVVRSQPVCVPEETPLREALALMRYRQVPCLLITKKGKLTGIFTERDFLMKAVGKPAAGSIGEHMSARPAIARPSESVGEAVEEMNAKGLRNLPLVDEAGAPASLVTVSGLIRYLADHFPAEVVNLPPQPQNAAETHGA